MKTSSFALCKLLAGLTVASTAQAQSNTGSQSAIYSSRLATPRGGLRGAIRERVVGAHGPLGAAVNLGLRGRAAAANTRARLVRSTARVGALVDQQRDVDRAAGEVGRLEAQHDSNHTEGVRLDARVAAARQRHAAARWRSHERTAAADGAERRADHARDARTAAVQAWWDVNAAEAQHPEVPHHVERQAALTTLQTTDRAFNRSLDDLGNARHAAREAREAVGEAASELERATALRSVSAAYERQSEAHLATSVDAANGAESALHTTAQTATGAQRRTAQLMHDRAAARRANR